MTNFRLIDIKIRLLSLFAGVASLFVSGCSSSRHSTPIELPLKASPAYHVEHLADDTNVLLLKTDQADLSGYVTALKSCGYPPKSSLRGSSRQIFVGLEKLRIIRQEYLELSPHRLYVVDAEAESDGLPIQLTTYSYKDDDCFFDYVLWVTPPQKVREKDPQALVLFDSQLNELRSHFRLYVGDALTS